MAECFNLYSSYYDLMYADKNYQQEVSYVVELLKKNAPHAKTVLDIGCGTGKHASLMAKVGYTISGVDMSASMLEQARKNFPHLCFHVGDARNFELNSKFDAIVSLFHVASYQVSNTDVKNYLISINKHLEKGGIVLFDFWYGPGVLNDRPVVRVKRLQNENIKVTRIAEPLVHENENYVDVNYEILIEDKKSMKLERLQELHKMRYFFLPEIQALLESNGFEMISSFDWLTNKAPVSNSWNVCVVGKKTS